MARVFLRCGHYAHDAAFAGNPLECPWGCGLQEREPVEEGFTTNITGDPVGEHYNHSLGEVVRSRSHLKRIQRTHGTQDFAPSPQMADQIKRGLRRKELARG